MPSRLNHPRLSFARLLPLILALAAPAAFAAEEDAPNRRPVKVVAETRIAVGDRGSLPLYLSADWSHLLPRITRAVIVLHGRLRNADVYYRSAQAAQAAAGAAGQTAIMIAPQFLAGIDVEAHKLPPDGRCAGRSRAGRVAIRRRGQRPRVHSTHWMLFSQNWPTAICFRISLRSW